MVSVRMCVYECSRCGCVGGELKTDGGHHTVCVSLCLLRAGVTNGAPPMLSSSGLGEGCLEDPDSGFHAYVASTVLIEPSPPQLLKRKCCGHGVSLPGGSPQQ